MDQTTTVSPVQDQLAALRSQIDAIDEQMLDLIGRRAALAEAISAAKRREAPDVGMPLRPARETQLVRRLLARAPALTDADVIVEVWRALMSASARRQQTLEIVVAGPLADPVRLFDQARRHFGAAAKITRLEDIRAAVTRVSAEAGVLAVLPWPGGSGPGGWWPVLNERRFHKLSIIAGLPMRAEATPAEPEAALLAANAVMEPAGEDITLGVAFDPHHKAARALAEAGVKGREIGRARETVLIAVSDFLAPNDPRVPLLLAAGLDGFRVVGSYARV